MPDQFQDMLVAHLPRLKAYAIMLTRNRTLAEDLLQETAMKALRAQSQFAMGTNFAAWIYKILRNEFISAVRRSKRNPSNIDDIPEEVYARDGEQESLVLSHEVMRSLEELRPDQREVLLLVCASGLSYQETAETLGCSIGTIKSRLWRARARMAQLLLGDENTEHQEIAQQDVAEQDEIEAPLARPKAAQVEHFSHI